MFKVEFMFKLELMFKFQTFKMSNLKHSDFPG